MNVIIPMLVCLCGGLGASARYVCDSYIKAVWRKEFPMSTFVINVVAGLLAGIVAGLYVHSTISGSGTPAVGDGIPRWFLHVLDHDERVRHSIACREISCVRRIHGSVDNRSCNGCGVWILDRPLNGICGRDKRRRRLYCR